jgi:hypothetical protein
VPTLDQYITGLSSLATLATAVATFWTVHELTSQRKAAVKPDVIPANQRAFVFLRNPPDRLRYWWGKEAVDETSLDQPTIYDIELFNVGVGAAKNLEIRWDVAFRPIVAESTNLLRKHMSL